MEASDILLSPSAIEDAAKAASVAPIYRARARGILSRTSGFIHDAGFTHSLTPARNCTYGCTYCYVPTMRIYGGLQAEDWRRWGKFTTFKENAKELVAKQLRPEQSIYCSPLVDPYQPAERRERSMPGILAALLARPPAVFVIQTRGPLILRDLKLLLPLAEKTRLRVSFSITTNRDDVRRFYEPHCEPVQERLRAVRELEAAGIPTFCTLAPILPCDPAALADLALEASRGDVIGDPFHNRAVKRYGATTRAEAERVSAVRGFERWHEPEFQAEVVAAIRERVEAAGRRFAIGSEGFRLLTL